MISQSLEIVDGFLSDTFEEGIGYGIKGIGKNEILPDENSELIIWVRAVAVAVLAAVIAKLTLVPPGALATVPLTVRLAAIACGFLAYLLLRRSVFAGLVTGEAVLFAGALLLAP